MHTYKHTRGGKIARSMQPRRSVQQRASLHGVRPLQDPDLPAFYFDPVVNPISAHASGVSDASAQRNSVVIDYDLGLPAGFEPLLLDTDLFNEHSASAIALYWAPRPFNMRSGYMRRSIDVPLVNSWFQEHCPPQHPVKVRVSYQKLLKCYVLNCLHARPPKGLKKKHLFPTLRNTKFFQATQLDWVEAGLQVTMGTRECRSL